MNFETIDCCPCPSELYPLLRDIQNGCGCTYNSIYRGEDPNAQKYLTGSAPCYKHNQAWIYAHYPPGVANPPGYSTHELKNDGVAYSWPPRGWSLQWWQCGLDVDDGHVQAFIATARKHGWIASITYPGSRVEYHHVNFRKLPVDNVISLKEGDRGARVWLLTHRLGICHYLNHSGWFFSNHVTQQVKKFQKDHHLSQDGVVGPSTWTQIEVTARRIRQQEKKK